MLRKLAGLGVRIAVDDYGTGLHRWSICGVCRSTPSRSDRSLIDPIPQSTVDTATVD